MKKLFENWRKYVNEEGDRRFTGGPGWIDDRDVIPVESPEEVEPEDEEDWDPMPPEELEDEEDIA